MAVLLSACAFYRVDNVVCVFLCRRYPTVERRARYAKGLKPENYFPLPEDAIIGAEAVKKCSKADEQV